MKMSIFFFFFIEKKGIEFSKMKRFGSSEQPKNSLQNSFVDGIIIVLFCYRLCSVCRNILS
jgi:hypothetical protein